MNKLAKKMANREGFTLVELIVVIAILGILAGIAIPVYSGYIAKAKEASDIQQMDAIKTATVFVLTENAISATNDTTAAITSMVVTSNTITANGTPLTSAELLDVAELTGLSKSTTDEATGTTTSSFYYEFTSGKTTATLADGQWKLS